MSELPIDAALPGIVQALRDGRSLVIRAEPGAGKTTRVPVALLEAGLAAQGEVIVAQPRRIAARMAAEFVARSLGEPVGRRVGYQVRFESAVSDATRIRFVTEGLLVRRLVEAPTLPGVSVVILDELHERHVDTDLALALLHRLQRTQRPDLAIVAMSATLDAGPVAAMLHAPTIDSAGRAYPVEVEHEGDDRERPLASRVAAAVRRLASEGLDGGVLVFLPGAREIREAAQACAGLSARLDVVPLHGELSAAEQDRAVRPGPRDKLVLATNVAETSITIDGIAAVVDGGLVRRPSHDPWTGFATLTVAKISRASAEQRRGRAGRTRPGRCVRLYTAADLERRPAHDEPEIRRLDLAGALLDLRAAGVADPDALTWLDPPPDASRRAADRLLSELGAIDEAGRLTAIGRAMTRLPLHPRLARLVVQAQARGVGRLGAGAAALLAERSIRRGRSGPRSTHADADVLADLADLDEARDDPGRASAMGLDLGACRRVTQARRQLEAIVGRAPDRSATPSEDLRIALLTAFPDRVGRAERRPGRPDRIVLAAGGDAELAAESVVQGADLVVALSVEQRVDARRTSTTIVRSAAHVEPEWLAELAGDRLVEVVQARFDPERERVETVVQTRWDGLVIEHAVRHDLPPQASALLQHEALARGLRAFVDGEALDGLVHRAAFVAAHRPEVPPIDDALLRQVLAQACEGRRSFAELRRADLLSHVHAALPPATQAALPRDAPTHVALPGGRRVRVRYEPDRPPWIESRLQDFFGMTSGPAVMDGRVALVLHLLAPNQRAVQVTTDLAGFWTRHYPDLRRSLMRRYPKHAWPEDPRGAVAPSGRR